jgi:hypothetical protein
MTNPFYTHISYITGPTQDILFLEDVPRLEGLPSGCIDDWVVATGKPVKKGNLPTVILGHDELQELLAYVAELMGISDVG